MTDPMTPATRPTTEELSALTPEEWRPLRLIHQPAPFSEEPDSRSYCRSDGTHWPCDASRLLDTVTALLDERSSQLRP